MKNVLMIATALQMLPGAIAGETGVMNGGAPS
jgi:hypothetical protein